MRKWGAIVALVIALLPLIGVFAAPTAYVRITAVGTDNGALPAPPDLSAHLNSNTEVHLTWVMGAGATGTTIRAKYGVAPTSILDGYAVYTGNATTATDWISDIEFSDNALWYSAWSYNGIGYSLTYDTAFVEGGDMAAAIGMVGMAIFFIVGVGINWIAWWREKWWVCPIAMFFWAGLAFYCYTEASTTFDFYKFLTWVCLGFMLVSIGEIFVLKKKAEEAEESMAERNEAMMNRNLANTFNRKRNGVVLRKPSNDDVGLGL